MPAVTVLTPQVSPISRFAANRGPDSRFPAESGNGGFPDSRSRPSRESEIPSPFPGQIGNRPARGNGNWGFPGLPITQAGIRSLKRHQKFGSSCKSQNSVYTTVYNRFFRKHGLSDRRNGQRNRAVTHTPNLSTTFAGIRRRCVRELRRVGQGGVRRFVPKSLSHGADQRARLARQKKPPKPVTLMPGLPW